MQPFAHRISRSVLLVSLCGLTPLALADATQPTVKTEPVPVDQVLGRASGEPFFQTRSAASVPQPVTDAYERAVEFLAQPPHPVPPDRFGRGGGNLPAGG